MFQQRFYFLIVPIFCVSCFGPFDPYNPAPDMSSPNDTSSTPKQQGGLVAYWNCNDSGKTLTDQIGHFDGVINGPTFDSGVEGRGLSFNGRGNVVLISTRKSTTLNFGTGDFTISLWVKPFLYTSTPDSNHQVIISSGVEGEHGITMTIIKKSFCAFVGRNQNQLLDTTFDATLQKWRHLVLLRRRSNVEFYVNAKTIYTYTNDDDVTPRDSNIILGDDASTNTKNEFPGMMDEIKISNTAWDISKITGEFNTYKSLTE